MWMRVARCPRWCGSQTGASISVRVQRAARAVRSRGECDAPFRVRRLLNPYKSDGKPSTPHALHAGPTETLPHAHSSTGYEPGAGSVTRPPQFRHQARRNCDSRKDSISPLMRQRHARMQSGADAAAKRNHCRQSLACVAIATALARRWPLLKELNSLVELFKLSLACKWRERERKALSGHIYTLPECNPLSPSRGRPSRALANLARGTSARGAGAIYICGTNPELSINEFYHYVSERRDRTVC